MSDEIFSEGNFTYTITNEQATLNSYKGREARLTIPEILGGYAVTSISESAFLYCSGLNLVVSKAHLVYEIIDGVLFDKTKNILHTYFASKGSSSYTIPHSVVSIGDDAFCGCSDLTEILVDNRNAHYSSDDGVLFNKDKTKLIQYPSGKQDTFYTIPDSVTKKPYLRHL